MDVTSVTTELNLFKSEDSNLFLKVFNLFGKNSFRLRLMALRFKPTITSLALRHFTQAKMEIYTPSLE